MAQRTGNPLNRNQNFKDPGPLTGTQGTLDTFCVTLGLPFIPRGTPTSSTLPGLQSRSLGKVGKDALGRCGRPTWSDGKMGRERGGPE